MVFHSINLDVADVGVVASGVRLKQFAYGKDVFRVFLKKNGEAYNPTEEFELCSVRFIRSDGRVNEKLIWKKNDESLAGVAAGEDGMYYCDVTYDLFCSFIAGTVGFEIIFHSPESSERVVCSRIEFEVFKSISSYNVIDQKSIDLIAHILEDMAAFKTVAEAQTYVDMLEAARVAEEERIAAENERVESEISRIDGETLRVINEECRINSENARVAAEGERIDAEVARAEAETVRVLSEDIRVGNETERVSAERLRVEAEEVRALAEADRDEAEKERAEAEAGREAHIAELIAQAMAKLVDSAPETLNTLDELAAALGDDPNFATTIMTLLGEKANKKDLKPVATSGSYNDLSDTPEIPCIDGLATEEYVNGKLSDINLEIGILSDASAQHKTATDNIKEDIQALDNSVAQLSEDLTATGNAVSENATAIDLAQGDINTLRLDVADNKSAIGDIETACDSIIAQQEAIIAMQNILIGGDGV